MFTLAPRTQYHGHPSPSYPNLSYPTLSYPTLSYPSPSLSPMESLMKSLNNLPAMSAGMYSRFTVILYQLVKKHYEEIDVQIVSTGEGIAVLALNSFIINPYAGITLNYSRNYANNVDYFLEMEVPGSPEILAFIKDFSKVLERISLAVPLTVENVSHRQSNFYKDSLAVDVHPSSSVDVHPRGGTWKKMWSDRLRWYSPLPRLVNKSNIPTVLESKFHFPRGAEDAVYGVELVCCNSDLEVEIIDLVADSSFLEAPCGDTQGGSCGDTQDDLFDPTIHFVASPQGVTPSGLYKPCCNLDVLPTILSYGDFAAGGLFSSGEPPRGIRYRVFSKTEGVPVTLNPKCPVFTMRLKINGMTVHPLTEADEAMMDLLL